jgi:hypothetical protein
MSSTHNPNRQNNQPAVNGWYRPQNCQLAVNDCYYSPQDSQPAVNGCYRPQKNQPAGNGCYYSQQNNQPAGNSCYRQQNNQLAFNGCYHGKRPRPEKSAPGDSNQPWQLPCPENKLTGTAMHSQQVRIRIFSISRARPWNVACPYFKATPTALYLSYSYNLYKLTINKLHTVLCGRYTYPLETSGIQKLKSHTIISSRPLK